MSGHSKWSSIKHKKARVDAQRGKIFSKLSRAIMIAAREGGGDAATNATLEAIIQKAKDYNMPRDNIERAIKRGTGELEGVQVETVLYEGYGPNGVALMVQVVTDNRNRTVSDIRNIFAKHGGNLGAAGCVSWGFDRKGHILVDKQKEINEDFLLDIVLETGAEDLKSEDNQWEIVTSDTDLMRVRRALEEKGLKVSSAEITMLPKRVVKMDKEQARKVLKLVDALEDHDEVQEVYANFDIPDEILEELAGN